jgi:hypothetical protein
MEGFAAFALHHMITGSLLYTTYATYEEILAANQRLSDRGLPHRYLPTPANAEIPLPAPR